MYLDFYKLHLKPFQISTDPRFLWMGEKHQEALAVLKYGILDNKGFLLLTGDVGTGKTTLLNALVKSLGENVLVAMVPDPGLAKMDFFNFVANAFGISQSFKSKGEFLIYLKNYLINLNQSGKQALLIIDECQRLNQKMLEEVRLLSNIEKAESKLINIFFVGQSEFNNIILHPHNRAIRQRITINYNISALSEAETDAYIRHRLSVAGNGEVIFTAPAIKEVHNFSNGYPRLINIVCDQALLTGFVREKAHIDEKIVAECAEELKIPHGDAIKESDATPEARIGKQETREAIPPHKWLLTVLRRFVQTGSPRAMALVGMVIVCGVLITVFAIERIRSDTNNSVDGTAPSGNPSAAAILPETTESADDPEYAGKGGNAALKAPSDNHDSSGQAPVIQQPLAGKQMQSETPDREQTRASSTPVGHRNLGQTVSLNEIYQKYGIYPEVHFEFNSNNLDAAGYEVLDMIAQFYLQHPEMIIFLRGYTDQSGLRAYNLKLSEFRAGMVKSYLVGRGVKGEAITTMAIGPDDQGPAGTKVPYDGERRKVVIEIIMPTG